jgi:long-chain acyl-CoA synthetase
MDALTLTLPGRLLTRAQSTPNAVALREKEFGVWREYSWHDYLDQVQCAAAGLACLGIQASDPISILSENRTEWLFADLGAQALGARAVGIYQTNPAPDVAYVLTHSKSKVLFCEDQEQVDKMMDVWAEADLVSHVVVFDSRGLRHLKDPRILSWDHFMDQGRHYLAQHPHWFQTQVSQLHPDDPAMVVYTSGTTGQPKGALLSGRNALEITDEVITLMKVNSKDSLLSYLPLCHVAEKIFTYFIPLCSGAVVHFGESIDTVRQDLVEVSPSIFLGVPRIWEKIHANITLKMKDSSWLKRTLFQWAMHTGQQVEERRQKKSTSFLDRLRWICADLLIFRPLQERLGLRRCRLPYSGAAPISTDLLSWFHGMGLRVHEGFGQTESAGLISLNLPQAYRLGSVGQAMPKTQVKIDSSGEILSKGPHVFVGYLHNQEATQATIDQDGWLYTGDLGHVDEEGFLYITGRKKEIIITAGGKNLSPEKIENALKMSPYIKEAIAIGDRRKFVSALIQIDLDATGDWATRHKIGYTSFEDLTSKSEVDQLIQDEIRVSNERLVRVEQVRRFTLLPKELHQDDGELTATQKVRRSAVHEKFIDLIETMYGGGHG